MNEKDIKKFLEEREELVSMLKSVSAKAPVDRGTRFERDLRARLLVELSRAKANKISFTGIINNMKYVYGGLAALVIVAGFAVFLLVHQSVENGAVALLGKTDIVRMNDRAFGSLGSLSGTSEATSGSATGLGGGAAASAPMVAQNLSARTPTMAPGVSTKASGGAGVSGTGVASGGTAVRPDIYYPNYAGKYVYKGGVFTQDQAKLDVLKKVSNPFSGGDAASLLARAHFGILDPASFANANITNITFTQDQPFGYVVNIDLANGQIYINSNWQTWPPNDGTEAPLQESDLPSTSTVIGIADQFIKDHDISMENYGAPELINGNRYFGGPVPLGAGTTKGAMTPNSAITSMPIRYSEAEQVLYPLILNGKGVYNQDGSKVGLSVEVDIRHKKVSNVYGLNIQSYEASSYDAITNTDTIISLAENPPFFPIRYMMMGASEGGVNQPVQYEIDLGTPISAYVEMYRYDAKGGQGSQFLVPAFVFPTTGELYNPSNAVVVPLIKDFIESNNPPAPIPMEGAPTKTAPGATPAPTHSGPAPNVKP